MRPWSQNIKQLNANGTARMRVFCLYLIRLYGAKISENIESW